MLVWMLALAWAGCDDQGEKEAAAVAKGLHQLGNNVAAGMEPAGMVARVRKLVDDGMVCTNEHRVRAAFVLMRGGPEDLDVAKQLAMEAWAATKEPSSGQMVAQAHDLARVKRGETQQYGVLTATVAGKACMYAWDPDFPDAKRAELGVKPLKELLEGFAEESGYTGALELEAMRDLKRLCDRQEEVVEEEVEEPEAFRPEPSSGE